MDTLKPITVGVIEKPGTRLSINTAINDNGLSNNFQQQRIAQEKADIELYGPRSMAPLTVQINPGIYPSTIEGIQFEQLQKILEMDEIQGLNSPFELISDEIIEKVVSAIRSGGIQLFITSWDIYKQIEKCAFELGEGITFRRLGRFSIIGNIYCCVDRDNPDFPRSKAAAGNMIRMNS